MRQQKEKLTNFLSEYRIALRRTEMKINDQTVCTTTVTSACEIIQGDSLEITAQNECLKPLNTELMVQAVFAFLKEVVRSLKKSTQAWLSVCSAMPSKMIRAACNDCQERPGNSASGQDSLARN